jgi:hypothetical protein
MKHSTARLPGHMVVRSSWRSSVLAILLLTPLGCAHVEPVQARLGRAVAGAHASAEPPQSLTTAISKPDGVVDISEPPEVVDEARKHARVRLTPRTLVAATEVVSWLPEGYTGASTEIELRNNCSLSFSYTFAESTIPAIDVEHPRRPLGAHTLELERVVPGQWLHLWDGDRWLGSAMTTSAQGRMDISPTCDALEVSFELRDRGPTSFAIHWELEADESLAAAPRVDSEPPLVAELQEQPEPWGPIDDGSVELRLANLCTEKIDYAFVPSFDVAPEHTASLAAHTERRVQIPAGWWLRYRALDEDWRGGATTSLDHGVVWIAADCLDFGVADGQSVGP